MDLKQRRKEIRNSYYPIPGLIIITCLTLFGILILFLSGTFNIKNFNDLYDQIYKNGFPIIIALFFVIISIYVWALFIINTIISPKRETLYLLKNKKDDIYFINKKGKKIDYDLSLKEYKVGSYYNVLKTKDYIYYIEEETSGSWNPIDKDSYWLNMYTPVGNFEGLLLLPIVYVLLLPGVLSIIMASGYYKIYGVIYSLIPSFVIGYDLLYKNKLIKSDNNMVDFTNFYKVFEYIRNGIALIVAIILWIIFIGIFIKIPSLKYKICFIPMLLVGIINVGYALANMFNKEVVASILYKSYLAVFLIYWFGGLTFLSKWFITQNISPLTLIPFWIAGLFILYKKFIKKNRNKKF